MSNSQTAVGHGQPLSSDTEAATRTAEARGARKTTTGKTEASVGGPATASAGGRDAW